MRTVLFLCIAFVFPLARSNDISPFHHALLQDSELAKRQNSCQDGYKSCAMLGAADACCEPETVCSRDAADNIACCPSGAACTGTVPTPTEGPSGSTGSMIPPSTTGFRFPQPGTATVTGPTITGAPFPFVIIPTTFADQSECVQSFSGCQSQLSECTAALGGVNGVTVGGNDGFGTTVPGAAPTANAQSVCSSLRDQACHALHVGYCTAFGPGSNTATGRSSALYDIFTGLAIAMAGLVA